MELIRDKFTKVYHIKMEENKNIENSKITRNDETKKTISNNAQIYNQQIMQKLGNIMLRMLNLDFK